MKKLFTTFFALILATSMIFASGHTITYNFSVDVPGLGLITTGDGTVSEGSSFTISPHTFTDKPYIQEAYDAVVGSSFTIPNDFVKENVTLSITLSNFMGDKSGYQPLQNGSVAVDVFMYFKIAVVGEDSGPHSASEHYPGGWPTASDVTFINPAVLTIPLTQKLWDFCKKCGITDDQLAFAYDNGGNLSTDGIVSTSDNSTLTVSIYHFSRFGGSGKGKLTDVSDKFDNALVKDFRLEQNYPNPFNPTTNISYSIPKEGYVSLKVYNTLGAEVKTLVSGNQKTGAHEVIFNAENLPSGVYFYTLRFDNTSQTKRMILIK